MYCRNCGNEMPDEALVCGKCGTPVKIEKADRSQDRENGKRDSEASGYSQESRRDDGGYYRSSEENPYRYEESSNGEQRNPYSYSNNNYEQKQEQKPEPDKTGKEGMATASLVLGIIAVVSCCIPYLAIPVSIAAIGFGILGYKSAARTKAIIGIVLGAAMLLVGMTLLISISALMPYSEELLEAFSMYME